MLKGLTEIYGEDSAKEEVDRIFALVDVDHSGEIDFSEFVAVTFARPRSPKDIRAAAPGSPISAAQRLAVSGRNCR